MKTVLVADDEYDFVRGLIGVLEKQYRVEYVADGREALKRIVQGGLDGIVLDNRMTPEEREEPEVGVQYGVGSLYRGKDVAKAVRRLFPELVIMVRSSDIDTSFRRELEPFGIYCQRKRLTDGEEVRGYFIAQFKE